MTPRRQFFWFADSPSPSDEEETNPLTWSFIGTKPTEPEAPVPFQAFNIESNWYWPEPETQSTAPKLSKPVENLFKILLKRNESTQAQTNKPLKIETMDVDNTETKPKTPTNPEATQNIPPDMSPIFNPSINPIFPPEPLTHKPIELKLAAPKPFTGNREDLNGFLLDLNLYLTVNREIYDDSFKKIRYALSFMTTGDTKSWKDQYLEESNKGEYLNLGTWT